MGGDKHWLLPIIHYIREYVVLSNAISKKFMKRA